MEKLNKPRLENYKINVKLKLASLWTALMFLYIYTDYFDMKAPGVLEQTMNLQTPIGPLTPTLLVIFSIILIVPSIMIFLSLFLNPTINKWLNIIVAVIWSSMSILLIVDLIGKEWYTFYILYQFVELAVFGMIVWQAWKWPKIETAEINE